MAVVGLDDLDSTGGRYRGLRVYGASKLTTVLSTRELAHHTPC